MGKLKSTSLMISALIALSLFSITTIMPVSASSGPTALVVSARADSGLVAEAIPIVPREARIVTDCGWGGESWHYEIDCDTAVRTGVMIVNPIVPGGTPGVVVDWALGGESGHYEMDHDTALKAGMIIEIPEMQVHKCKWLIVELDETQVRDCGAIEVEMPETLPVVPEETPGIVVMEREYEYEFKVGGKVHRGKIEPLSKETLLYKSIVYAQPVVDIRLVGLELGDGVRLISAGELGDVVNEVEPLRFLGELDVVNEVEPSLVSWLD